MTRTRHILTILFTAILAGCGGGGILSQDDGPLMVGDSIVDSLQLCMTIDSIVAADHDTTAVDRALRLHYGDTHELCWIGNDGVTAQADTLMAYISRAGNTGIRQELFLGKEIKADRLRLDSLDFREVDMYTVLARLDYNLTKAFMRYSAWQRYGIVNPHRVFNRLDFSPHDTVRTTDFRTLYDTPTESIGKEGLRHLATLAGTDSVEIVLNDAEPKSPLYAKLKEMLPGAQGKDRKRILVNMERCRWRHKTMPDDHERYVVVNIPSYELIGHCPDSTLEMRIVCGSRDTKTPLMHSALMRMDINPQWTMPRSVIKYEIARHAGDSAYFARHRYHIKDPKTGDHYNPARVTRAMLEAPGLRVYQEGGKGNALGRIIFRFDNNLSIYLHDTSSKETFSRDDRRASHGCIRVQKPYELAQFLLTDKDEALLEKLHYSMTSMADTLDPKLTVRSLKIEPHVPIFITYYTIFQHPDGTTRTYPDVYGYDDVLYERIKDYGR